MSDLYSKIIKDAGIRTGGQISAFKTRAKNQRAQAKALLEQAKGKRSKAATENRAKAKHLKQLARGNEAKAKQAIKMKEAFKEITPESAHYIREQYEVFKKFESDKQKETKEALQQKKDQQKKTQAPQPQAKQLTLDQATIDTVLELVTNGRGRGALSTPVAIAISDWVDENRAKYGDILVAHVCMKALQDNPYIFEEYIYDSDQTGYYATSALITLDAYAQEYLDNYKAGHYTDEQAGLTNEDTIESQT